MIIIHDYPIALCMFVLNMICFGSWSNTLKLAEKQWRHELFHWDFIFGLLLTILIAGFTLGSLGNDGETFITNLANINSHSVLFAMLAGILLNTGLSFFIAAISTAGMVVAFPIGGGVAWLGNIMFNYFLEIKTGEINGEPKVLFVGVATVLIAIYLCMLAYRKLAQNQQKTSTKGLLLSACAGVFGAFFYGCIIKSISPNYINGGTGVFTPYTGLFFFAIGVLLATIIFQPLFMAHPTTGEPIKIQQYFTTGKPRYHILGMLGGCIWGIGLTANIISASATGPTIAIGLGNASPVIAMLWGIFAWKEFKGAPKGTNAILFAMFLLYIIGLNIITYSKIATGA